MIALGFCLVSFHFICSYLFLLLLPSKPRDVLSHPRYSLVIFLMAPIVWIDPNGSQELLSHDDAVEDLKGQGWDIFVKNFKGYNLHVAKEFAQMFDGYRAKVGDIQLEVIEDFLSEATGLPLSDQVV